MYSVRLYSCTKTTAPTSHGTTRLFQGKKTYKSCLLISHLEIHGTSDNSFKTGTFSSLVTIMASLIF